VCFGSAILENDENKNPLAILWFLPPKATRVYEFLTLRQVISCFFLFFRNEGKEILFSYLKLIIQTNILYLYLRNKNIVIHKRYFKGKWNISFYRKGKGLEYNIFVFYLFVNFLIKKKRKY
jgi:hypothetical protein